TCCGRIEAEFQRPADRTTRHVLHSRLAVAELKHRFDQGHFSSPERSPQQTCCGRIEALPELPTELPTELALHSRLAVAELKPGALPALPGALPEVLHSRLAVAELKRSYHTSPRLTAARRFSTADLLWPN